MDGKPNVRGQSCAGGPGGFACGEQSRGTRDGAILVVVLVVLVLATILGSGMLAAVMADASETGRAIGVAQAFWAAEAGVKHAKAFVTKNHLPFAYINYAASPTGCLFGNGVIAGATAAAAYRVDVLDDATWTNSANVFKKYVITSHGTARNGAVQTATQRGTVLNYASLMHASNLERNLASTSSPNPYYNNYVFFYYNSDVSYDGPVYVNEQIHIYGGNNNVNTITTGSTTNPIFRAPVYSIADTVFYYGKPAGPYPNVRPPPSLTAFAGGLNLGRDNPRLDISGEFCGDHILRLRQAAQDGGIMLTNGNYRLHFDPNGTFTSQLTPGGTINTHMNTAMNGMIYVQGDAYVDGVLNGQVTLASHGSIYITNNGIAYATASSPNPTPWDAGFNLASVTDALGLVASNKVEITGTNSIYIHAAIMVTGTNILATSSNLYGFCATYRTNMFTPQPIINLFGGVTQYRTGYVNALTNYSSTFPLFKGFRRSYRFDQRFLTNSPPNYPYSVNYDHWQQSSGIP